MVDLHVHSTRSDGTYTPAQLVDYAREKGLTAFALTDHDSVDGLDEAIGYAARLRLHFTQMVAPDTPALEAAQIDRTAKPNIRDITSPVPEVIPGIELSSEYQGKDVHIVGLFIDYHNAHFQEYLRGFVASRDARNHKMCTLLQKAGMDISYEKLQEAFPNSVITRAHYAKYMLEHGYIKSMAEAFDRYVGDHCPCYVPREKVTPAQAVALILEAGGIPILAHPILYHLSDARLDALVSELKEAGLMGIEALYSTYHACDERQIRSLAKKYDLLISGGSDFHGDNKPGLDLGTGYGGLCVPEEVLVQIRRAHDKADPSQR
ncbi:MAG: PHP domain-containing protein [Acetatifactor sp.]|nr:PHP domain-containing protein [Acetatifactor sp.]